MVSGPGVWMAAKTTSSGDEVVQSQGAIPSPLGLMLAVAGLEQKLSPHRALVRYEVLQGWM